MQKSSETNDVYTHPIPVAKLSSGGGRPFDLTPSAEERKVLAQTIGASTIRKLTFSGALEPLGKSDWQLKARLGATVVQSCVVTLAPVTTRIDEDVPRRFLKKLPEISEGSELEFDGDDEIELLESEIDLGVVLTEALVLLLPEYPRAEGVELEKTVFAGEGIAAMTDEDAKPFASLAKLRAKLQE